MKDPICGMNVDETIAKYESEHKGRKYVFCSSMCKEEFEKNRREILSKNRTLFSS